MTLSTSPMLYTLQLAKILLCDSSATSLGHDTIRTHMSGSVLIPSHLQSSSSHVPAMWSVNEVGVFDVVGTPAGNHLWLALGHIMPDVCQLHEDRREAQHPSNLNTWEQGALQPFSDSLLEQH